MLSLLSYFPTILGLATVTAVATFGLRKVDRLGETTRTAWTSYMLTAVLLLATLLVGILIASSTTQSPGWTRYAAALVVGSAVEMAIFFVSLIVMLYRSGTFSRSSSSSY